jgi:hypothetical protein
VAHGKVDADFLDRGWRIGLFVGGYIFGVRERLVQGAQEKSHLGPARVNAGAAEPGKGALMSSCSGVAAMTSPQACALRLLLPVLVVWFFFWILPLPSLPAARILIDTS